MTKKVSDKLHEYDLKILEEIRDEVLKKGGLPSNVFDIDDDGTLKDKAKLFDKYFLEKIRKQLE